MYVRCVSLLRVVLPAGLIVLALAACEGGGGGPVSSARPSAALPTLSGSLPTRSAAPEESASGTPRVTPTPPTRSAVAVPTPTPLPNPTTPDRATGSRPAPPLTATRTPDGPTQTPTPTPTATVPSTAVAAPTSTSLSTPPSTPAATAVSSSPSPWVWWLLGLLIVAAGIALVVVAVRRRRTRKAWSARRAGAVMESTWLAHDLVPNVLSAQSPAARRDMWIASRPRVDALQRNLSELVASASKEQAGSLDRLRDAVTGLRWAMDAYAVTDAGDPERLGAARQAQRQLEDALRAIQPPPAPGGV